MFCLLQSVIFLALDSPQESVCFQMLQHHSPFCRCQVKDVFKELKLMQTVGKNTLSSHCIEDQVDGAVSLQVSEKIPHRYSFVLVG